VLNDNLTFADDGAKLFRAELTRDHLDSVEAALAMLPQDQAGIRIRGVKGLTRHERDTACRATL
jgi:hypothetical protein